MKNLIIVFTRNPELGKCKTRLAKTIGDQNALEVYKLLLNHTEKTIRKIDSDKAVYYSVKVRENDIWTNSIYQKHRQIGTDLGERMKNSFQQSFESNYDKVIIIGSDLFDLKAQHIETAFDQLDHHDIVIGPAKDGGYYLLGMKKNHPQLFKNKTWGTELVFEQTLKSASNLSVSKLDYLNDIDTFDDIKDYSYFQPYLNTVNE